MERDSLFLLAGYLVLTAALAYLYAWWHVGTAAASAGCAADVVDENRSLAAGRRS